MKTETIVKGEVISQDAVTQGVVVMPWPAKLCCFDCCNCAADLGLCCYAAWCAPCLWSEIAEHLSVSPIEDTDPEMCSPCMGCTSRRCATNYWAFIGFQFFTSVAQGAASALGCQSVANVINLVPCLTMKSRQVLEQEHGLEVQCNNAYCADYWCGASSTYQQAVYVKHVLKKDFASVYYKNCKKCCCCGANPAPGAMKTALPPPAGYAAITQQPVAAVV